MEAPEEKYLTQKQVHDRWTGIRAYETHNNGGRPFMVFVDQNKVYLYRDMWDPKNYSRGSIGYLPLGLFEAETVFIGESPRNEMTEFSGGYGPEFSGNSILLHLKDNNYLYIGGEKPFYFNSINTITEYVSPVGNNDVPYPYAIDKDGRYYLMIENVILESVPDEKGDDPYRYYYSKNLMSSDRGYHPPKQPEVKIVDKWLCGTTRYTLRYNPKAAWNYDRLMSRSDDNDGSDEDGTPEKMSIVRNGVVEILSKEEYIELMTYFGKRYGFSELKSRPLSLSGLGTGST